MKIKYLSASIDINCGDLYITLDIEIKCPICGETHNIQWVSGFHEANGCSFHSYSAHCRFRCFTCRNYFVAEMGVSYDAATDEYIVEEIYSVDTEWPTPSVN